MMLKAPAASLGRRAFRQLSTTRSAVFTTAVPAAKCLSSSATADTVATPSIALYQYAICPFCNKVKALLSYAGVRANVVEVNPLNKAELKELSSEYKKVPIAIIDGQQINGSEEIVGSLLGHSYVQSTLEDRWTVGGDGGEMTMDTFRSSDAATRWAKFANDDLAALIYPNLCRTLGDSYRAFGYVGDVQTFSAMQKAMIKGVGSLAMYFAASKIKKKRGIEDEQKALRDAILTWEQEGLDGGRKPYASGLSEPDLGDITVYGTLRSVEGLPAHDMAIGSSDIVKDWYQRMQSKMKV